MATIKNNALNLPNTFDSANKKACICKVQEKKEEKFAKAAYLRIPYCKIVKECFQCEVQQYLISLLLLMHSPIENQ